MNRHVCITVFLLLSSLTLFSSFGPDQILFGPRFAGMAAADINGDESPESILSNPAGLTLINRGKITFGAAMPSSSATLTTADTLMESPSESSTSLFIGAAYPISEKLIVGAIFCTPTSYSLNWPGEDLKALSGNHVYTWQSKLQIKKVSAAAAYTVSDKIALGVSLNVESLSFQYELPFGTGQYDESSSASALTFSIGIRMQLTPQLSAGVSYTSSPSWDLSGTANMANAVQIGLSSSSALTRPFNGASRLTGGITFHFSDKIKFAASFLSSSWSDLAVLEGNFADSGWTRFFGSHDLDLNWTSTLQIRIGTEYQANDKLIVRAGFATCPSATPEKNRHPLLFSLPGQMVSIGGSVNLGQISFDASLIIPFTSESVVTSQQTSNWPGTYEASMIIPSLSISYHF